MSVPWGFDGSMLLSCSPGLEVAAVQGLPTTGHLEAVQVPMEVINGHCIVPLGVLSDQGHQFSLALRYNPLKSDRYIMVQTKYIQIQMTYVDWAGRTICTVYNKAFPKE